MTLIVPLIAVALQTGPWSSAPPTPIPVANNAVVATSVEDRVTVFSLLGIDRTRRWDGVTNRAFQWTMGDERWTEITPVPGPGRLAPTAQAVGGRIFLFGGYTVAEDGSERSLPNVDIYDPRTREWRAGAAIPVPVDDAVSGVWRDSLVYLISGWHDRDNVPDVQIYDPGGNRWSRATPFPGRPVFGHAGGLAGNTIVIVDGAARTTGRSRYEMAPQSWRGDIDPSDPTQISWSNLPPHPGPPVYRAAGVGVNEWIIVAGGTDNPYNYDGIGYDGVPAKPSNRVFGFEVRSGQWHVLPSLELATMDHRTIAVADGRLVLAGGMVGGQRVSDRVVTAELRRVVGGR